MVSVDANLRVTITGIFRLRIISVVTTGVLLMLQVIDVAYYDKKLTRRNWYIGLTTAATLSALVIASINILHIDLQPGHSALMISTGRG